MAKCRVLRVVHHDLRIGSSRFVWEMQLVRTRNGLSFRFGIEDGHRPTPKGHTRNWQVSVYYNRFGNFECYRVSPAFGGDRRIGDVMMDQMKALSERNSALLRECA